MVRSGGGEVRRQRNGLAGLAVAVLPLGIPALLAACAAAVPQPAFESFRNPTPAEATTWLAARPPDARVRYADESPSQFGDLRLPAARAPAAGYPVAVIVHGGAWHADWTNQYTDAFAEALAGGGIAIWNIEFRRIGNRGGGYPGTFVDAGRATDFLRTLAARHPLDLSRVVVVGHSAGGHLALWLAGRRNLPEGSALRGRDPLPLAGVVSLAGVNDLEAALTLGDRTDILALIGADAPATGGRLAETSPARLIPLGVPQVLVIGTRDEPWRLEMTRNYAAAAAAAGDAVELITPEGANHFDVVDPAGPAVGMVARAVRALVDVPVAR